MSTCSTIQLWNPRWGCTYARVEKARQLRAIEGGYTMSVNIILQIPKSLSWLTLLMQWAMGGCKPASTTQLFCLPTRGQTHWEERWRWSQMCRWSSNCFQMKELASRKRSSAMNGASTILVGAPISGPLIKILLTASDWSKITPRSSFDSWSEPRSLVMDKP